MFEVWQAATLGMVQGLTEFLPISSSAHLKSIPWMLGWTPPANELAFDVALHLGTLAAVAIYFLFEWLLIVASYIGDLRQRRWLGGAKGSLLPKLVVATVPAAVVGKLLDKHIEAFFYDDTRNMWMVACVLALFGLLLLAAERRGTQKNEMEELTWGQALLIGCAQALAVVPGVSRSGVTIFAGLLLGLKRPAAARFSFLLATPIIAGATFLEAPHLSGGVDTAVIAGVLAAAVSGLAAIRFLLGYVQRHRYDLFVYYRWLFAALILAVFLVRKG